jgi:hypothetical protein
MPRRLCLEPGCANAATYRGRCASHARDRERSIERRGNYSAKRWKLARRHQLFNEPLCTRCGRIAKLAHHIDGIEKDPRHELLESLCTSCHSKLHRAGG